MTWQEIKKHLDPIVKNSTEIDNIVISEEEITFNYWLPSVQVNRKLWETFTIKLKRSH